MQSLLGRFSRAMSGELWGPHNRDQIFRALADYRNSAQSLVLAPGSLWATGPLLTLRTCEYRVLTELRIAGTPFYEALSPLVAQIAASVHSFIATLQTDDEKAMAHIDSLCEAVYSSMPGVYFQPPGPVLSLPKEPVEGSRVESS